MLFQFIKKLFGSSGDDDRARIQEIADKISRFIDRFRNANDEEGVQVAEYYHRRILNSKQLEEAEILEKEFYRELKKKGISLDRYNRSQDSGTHYHDHSHYHTRDTLSDDAVIGYTVADSMADSGNFASESGGEFGGAGSEDSWDDSQASDNS